MAQAATVIPLRRGSQDEQTERAVVAVVLADGTVRRLDSAGQPEGTDWTSGQISGDDWVLWWQRRSFEPR